jgi:hypothetical protein
MSPSTTAECLDGVMKFFESILEAKKFGVHHFSFGGAVNH